MTDGHGTSGELDHLDAAWDALNRGRPGWDPSGKVDDVATISALSALVSMPPPVGRRIWSTALVTKVEPRRQWPGRDMNSGGQPVRLVAPSGPGWGWLHAGLIAVVASLAILGGILFGRSDGDGVTRTLPSDASSVVATLPSSAPAWATPGGEEAN